MELRTVDPRRLTPNPNNPRHISAGDHADEQFVANIKAVGIIQPPLIKEKDDRLEIIAGHRRIHAAIAAGFSEILVLVKDPDDAGDILRAVSENVVRANLGPVDQWRAIEALSSDNWTEDAIGAALALPVRIIKKLRLLAHIHPAMLDHIAKGDMPNEAHLRVIAAAGAQEQASVWKKHKPKKGDPNVHWHIVANALQKRQLYAKVAKFGRDEEQAFGLVWEEDLFSPADEDARYTTNVEAFFAAQHAWLESNLPKNGVVLAVDDYGREKLPPKAERVWSAPKRGDSIGFYIDPRSGSVEQIAFRVPKPEPKKGKSESIDSDDETFAPPAKTRPDITKKGMDMIGDFRTDALSKALLENAIDDGALLGLLILACTASNVEIKTGEFSRAKQRAILQRITEGGHLTQDLAILRQAAREILAAALTCRTNYNSSGIAARFAGDAIGADAHLPNMATEDFLSCLSKPAIERAASAIGVTPRQKAKDTRAALIAQVGQAPYVLPDAVFAPNERELTAHRETMTYWADDDENDLPPSAPDDAATETDELNPDPLHPDKRDLDDDDLDPEDETALEDFSEAN